MFRNNYDNDSVTFSPQGRIFQIEYAGEAVKQGSVAVGIVSKTHVVLCAVKRNAEELSSYQKKIFPIHDHAGLVMAGLTSDARVLTRFMNTQSLGHTLTYGRSIPISTLVSMVGSKAQINTQAYGKRPYGVGMLIAGMDENGAHLFQIEPSGATEEMIAFAIGARSQMARTYLEKNSKEFADCSREELVVHGLKALRESLPQDKALTVENTSVGVVGISDNGDLEPFRVYDDSDVLSWIESSGNEPETSTMEVDL